MRLLVLFSIGIFASASRADSLHPIASDSNFVPFEGEEDGQYWIEKAQAALREQSERIINTNVAKNVILFLGDGMSVTTLSASRIYNSEINGKKSGEGDFLSFEKFPYTGLSRTYCVDKFVADSACSATAYLGGVKGIEGTIGVDGHVRRGDCEASKVPENRVNSIAKWAQAVGKKTGAVTTTRISHASPAGLYAHTPERDWENDAAVPAGRNCDDIVKQLVLDDPGKNLNVIMGGGRANFIPDTENDPEEGKGNRKDGENFINAWIQDKAQRNESYGYVWNRDQLLNLDDSADYLLGLFAKDHLDFHIQNNTNQPTLEEMTERAIRLLARSSEGYFLFVEGGRIDSAHHENKAHVSLDETLEFSKAIAKAVELTDEKDTLIVVTSDHSHTMTISGYADRSKSIFGFGGTAQDGYPYLVLNYGNGAGYRLSGDGRADPTHDPTGSYDYLFPAGVPLGTETHGGDDVAVFARGPWSHLFVGSYEQNYIPHAMAYASCIGNGLTACDNRREDKSH